MNIERLKVNRYFYSGISYLGLAILFYILSGYYLEIDQEIYRALVLLSILLVVKGIGDIGYGFNIINRSRFHLFTVLHYIALGILLIYYKIFGIIISYLFGIIAIVLSILEARHVYRLEDEIPRIFRHIVSGVFRWLFGSTILFNMASLYFIEQTTESLVLSLTGTVVGIITLYSALLTFYYIIKTSELSARVPLR